MLDLISLVCYGCESTATEHPFFDSEKKRPREGECGHRICQKCVDTCIYCPICPNHTFFKARTGFMNYDVLRVLEEFEADCFRVYRNWWEAKDLDDKGCVQCHSTDKMLRICIDCNGSYGKESWKCIWMAKKEDKVPKALKPEKMSSGRHSAIMEQTGGDFFRAMEVLSEEEFAMFNDYSSDEEVEEIPLQKSSMRLSLLSDHQIFLLKANLICSDCLIDSSCHEKGHRTQRLRAIDFWAQDIKRALSEFAAKFLWKVMKSRGETPCKLRSLRLLRTCEVLTHYANLHVPWIPTQKFEPFGKNDKEDWEHRRAISKVSKYFEGLHFENRPEEAKIDLLIESLQWQWEKLKKVTKTCKCDEKWEDMKDSKLWNQVEKAYCEIINNHELTEKIDNCPLTWSSSSEALEVLEASETYWLEQDPLKLHLLPTVVCYSKQTDHPDLLFDHHQLKPIPCPNCYYCSCHTCVKKMFLKDCPICGYCIQTPYPRGNEYQSRLGPCDNGVLKLLRFYKGDALKLLETWWKMEMPPGEGYCVSCHSYSTQLEICIHCEQRNEESSLHTTNQIGFGYAFQPGPSISKFPLKWQCSECSSRLEAKWNHSKCDTRGEKYLRGCNHLGSRLDMLACSSKSNCAESVIRIRDVKYSEHIWKAATWSVVRSLLKSGIQTSDEKILKTIQELEAEIEEYFKIAFSEDQEENLKIAAEKVEKLLETLKRPTLSHGDA